jgi:hypothetical protein
MENTLIRLVLLLLLSVVAFCSGCATTSTDTENRAERPWDAPMGWEHGLPPNMMQGR